jgi:hypothetical protein
MLERRRSGSPVLEDAFHVAVGVLAVCLGVALVISLFGFVFHVLFFVARLALIAGLLLFGFRLLAGRSRRGRWDD